jgi:catechol 2,3-dioxygenase-like lactoylglutathione lyase family enzyme
MDCPGEMPMKHWYSRCVFFVRDMTAAQSFYVAAGFALGWSHAEDGRILVCQVNRDGLELILSEDPEKAGRGRVFISLDDEQTRVFKGDLEKRRIAWREGHWGMPVIEILDPDGNELMFSPPA